MAYLCSQQGVVTHYLDARNIEPTPEAFLETLQRALDPEQHRPLFEVIAAHPNKYVIFLDTYETITPLDDWFREVFLPQLPENAVVVVASRHSPSIAWRTDPGWQTPIRQIPLRNLSPDESRTYLKQRSVPEDQYPKILDFTHGHPLALSLIADVLTQRPGTLFQPDESPDVIRALMDELVSKVPSPAHRAALEICSLVRLTTESLLTEVLNTSDAHELFEWLTALSCIEASRGGLFLHDLVREVLVADLRWRNPEWYAELRQRIRIYYTRLLQQNRDLMQQQRILLDYLFLHRDNGMVRPFFEWQIRGTMLADRLHDSDHEKIADVVTNYEGEESASLARYWMRRRPEGVVIIRGADQQFAGFLMMVALHEVSEADFVTDPALFAASEYLNQQAPLRPGEKATMFRFWMAEDTYQDVSLVQSLLFIHMVRHCLTTPGLAYTFFCFADPEFWSQPLEYAAFYRIEKADFDVAGYRYGIYGYDWRATPPSTWLAHMAEKETALFPTMTEHQPTEELIVLSKSAFAQAVRDALRDFVNIEALHSNPLLRSRLILGTAGVSAGLSERAATLIALLRDTIGSLQQSPRQMKLYRALYHTYIQPASTQEEASELLDVPFSSFRRHLKTGIDYIIEALWQKEIHTV
jgi:hypothetical protein